MLERIRLLATISRAEFLMPNLGSLLMGLAWGVTSPIDPITLTVLVASSFAVINLSSAIGAQLNTLYDYDLDLKDPRKKHIVQALDAFGQKRLKMVLAVEFILNAVLVSALSLSLEKPLLLLMWVVGISLGYAYSAPPARLKSRFWLAPIALIFVLAVLPVLFAYHLFTTRLNYFFIMSLVGLALTVYGVIVPTEIRDYFGDNALNVETMTVRLGLVKASILSVALLSTGGILVWAAFTIELIGGSYPFLAAFPLVILAVIAVVLKKFGKLYLLSKKYAHSNADEAVGEDIVAFSAQNLRWILLVTQTYSLMSLMLLAEKLLT